MFKFFDQSSNKESVYDLVRDGQESGKKDYRPSTSLYRSIHSGQARKERVENKSGLSKTLGVPHIPLEAPSMFLKKHSKRPFSTRPQSVPAPTTLSVEKGSQTGGEESEVTVAKTEHDQKVVSIPPKTYYRLCNNNRKPGIQPAHVPLQIIMQENKDFVKTNASNILNNSKLNLKPKMLRYVDMSNGNTELWYNSGLAPQYIYRRNFGKVPTYLMKRKEELLQTKEALEQDAIAATEASDVKKLRKDEINKMVEGLKDSWKRVFHLYQSLPLQIDTPGKIKTKSRLEAQLKKIENDIQTLQRHDFIYVADVPRSYYVPVMTKRG